MQKLQILDCTLRDGGYVNDWLFGESTIKGVIKNLGNAKIDIVECGFIRGEQYSKDSSVFSSMKQLEMMIAPKIDGMKYAAMIEHHNHVDDLIPDYDGNGVDIIRLTFRKNEWKDAKGVCKKLIQKGYKVCVQPVGTSTYDDASLLNLLMDVNEINPYAFYLVDTLGVMYTHEIRRFFYLIDNNLSKNIKLGFHSHNNLQMSFANTQEIIRLANKRDIIVDSSCYGMGRGVGNLATELIADYINCNIEPRYSLVPLLNIVDKYLMPIYSNHRWGYDLPYFLSAISKCHPNYASYLIKKETLDIESIEKILSLIPIEDRSEFNYKLIENLYLTLQTYEVNDGNSFKKLIEILSGRNILLLGSGSSIELYSDLINEYITENKPYIISINYIDKKFNSDAMFISNEKRLSLLDNAQENLPEVFFTSNLKNKIKRDALMFNYTSFLGEGDENDNAGAMIIKILRKANVKKIYIAGFDGFDVDSTLNYYDTRYSKLMDYDTVQKKNNDISKQLKMALDGIDYSFITRTKYEI